MESTLSPVVDYGRLCLLVSNDVNLFDSAIDQVIIEKFLEADLFHLLLLIHVHEASQKSESKRNNSIRSRFIIRIKEKAFE